VVVKKHSLSLKSVKVENH